MSEENITLFDLLNLSIGTPQQGAVNFSALHALLHAVLRQLGVRELKIQWRNSHPGDADTGAPVGVSGPRHSGEEQLQIEGDRETEVQPGTELQERTTSSSVAPTRSSGTAADGQSELRSRIQTCEDGVSKAMRLIHELHNPRDDLKEEVKELHHQQKMVGAQAETVAAVETCCHRSEEVDIIGLDGHIYRGRLNPSANRNTETKLPTISTKDGLCKIKDKAKCSPSHKPAASPEALHHLHSAKSTQCSRSASSSSGRDWPVSTLGCTSQSSIAQASAAAERTAEPQDDQQADL
ncbi:uncharacterized protein AKAME5_000274600 [Lates japonicus]|uniref:Uncharacterized protein n=1 Tax=Lates japonicus TaxID=270547 RepID=A0AAD3M7P2_LATJO|nr:uncharacterized protein AKAME5_000274600 [Lates japonicus]